MTGVAGRHVDPISQNFTFGTVSTSVRLAPRSKKSLRVKPNMPANRAAGICWMPVLYSWTALLKKRRLAAILFSRSASSLANCWKLALALRSGYASDSAIRRRSEEHTSESSHPSISYAVFCLKKKKKNSRNEYNYKNKIKKTKIEKKRESS